MEQEKTPKCPYLSAPVVFVAGETPKGRMEFAAMVVGVADPFKGIVKLALFTLDGISFPAQMFAYSALPQPGTWHWPDKSTPVLVATQGVPLQEIG